jgi:iron complex outermembrane recepter protein
MTALGSRTVRTALMASISLSALFAAAPGRAQTTAAADVDDGNEIVVTTRRIEERLQDVPISVTALTAEALARQNIDDLTDVAEKTVGFAFETFTGPLAQPVIRGQTNLRTTSPVQNVATNLNGIYIQRGYFVDQSLLDLERIEIIKGPQSALYGRNAFAGVINLQTRSPDLEELSGRLSGTIGNYGRYEGKAGINIPIAPGTFAIYAASGYSKFDGTWANNHPLADADVATTRGRLGGWEKRAMQLGAKLKVGIVTAEAMYIRTVRALESNPSYTISTIGNTNAFNTLNASPSGTGTTLVTSGPFGAGGAALLQNRLFVGAIPTLPVLAPGETRRPGLVVDPRSYGLRGPSTIYGGKISVGEDGPVRFEYQYGHTEANIIARGSSQRDPSTPVILPPFGNLGNIFDSSGTDSRFTSDSHEGKVSFDVGSGLTGFVGVNFTKTSDIESNASELAPVNSLAQPDERSLFPVRPGGAIPTTVLFRRTTFLQRTENVFAAFGFLQWKPTANLAITLEGRYTEESQRATDLIAPDFGGAGPAFIALTPPTSRRDAKFFTPRGSITYKFNDDHNIYASVGRGYKSGGINGVAANYNRTTTIVTPGQANQVFVDAITVGSPIPAARSIPTGSTGSVLFTQLTPGTAGLSQLQQNYDAETNWTYEIGSKNRFFGGALTLNVAAYYTDWRNLQSNAVRLQADGTAPVSFAAIVPSTTGNVGDVRIYGFEVEGSWRATRELRIDFGAAYNNARYKTGTVSQRFGASGNCNVAAGATAVCTTVADPRFPFRVLPIGGKQLERTPAFDALLGINYDTKFDNGWGFFARADVTYQTKQYVDEANLAFVPARTLVNGSIGVNIDKFNFQLWAKNLFDKQYATSALFLIGIGGANSASYVPILGERRTIGLTVSTSF